MTDKNSRKTAGSGTRPRAKSKAGAKAAARTTRTAAKTAPKSGARTKPRAKARAKSAAPALAKKLYQDALDYHQFPVAGKAAVVATKPLETQRDLALAYSPGVAAPCLEIAADAAASYDYTSRGNTVAVISNGTAVLGLGSLGALASKPVMEGKAVLFRRFADVSAVDIQVDTEDVDEFVSCVAAIGRSFGGINLEDIRAPQCFPIEERLAEKLDIPVFHDDQHGTAIIVLAGIINALDITGRQMKNARTVIVGAGAAAAATARLLRAHGMGEVILVDSRGVLHSGRRSELDEWRAPLAVKTRSRTAQEALRGADVVIGLSRAGAIRAEWLKMMRRDPVLFLLSNPVPEVAYEVARRVRPDAIIATGRSDYPNQVNNVLGFPYIFRGALDVRARRINTAMKRAAAEALAQMTRSDTPEEVDQAYRRHLQYGPDYIIPTPFDPRLLCDIPLAVARAAVRSGVAGVRPEMRGYASSLMARHDPTAVPLAGIFAALRRKRPRVIFAEGEEEVTVRAAWQFLRAGYGRPLLLGSRARVLECAEALSLPRDFCPVLNAADEPRREMFAEALWTRRRREGFLMRDAVREVNRNRNVFGASLLAAGGADAMVTGLTRPYHVAYEDLRLVIDAEDGVEESVFGFHILIHGGQLLLLADTVLHESPGSAHLAAIARALAVLARGLKMEPRVAFLSFSTFGNPPLSRAEATRGAVRILEESGADFEFEGEMEARIALDFEIMGRHYPFSRLSGPANVLVLPSLNAASIAVQLLEAFGPVTSLGPFLHGLAKPVGIVPFGSGINNMVLSASFAAYDSTSLTK
ncbi:MAG: NADP-dependent malic enzyme [Alphaproteobacteria bacterium]|nr:NADP-dependent malic enzyme [Alphaproteobacteria bacterium]MDA7989145.1 NADP-dependent malic enzyme [Alphaproteobacteria bacterium]